MKKIAKLTSEDRQDLFLATAIKMKMRPEVIEKDFWVCYMLDHLFNDSEFNGIFVFKGGTSLSKSYHVIERFSEDIDLILDWRELVNDRFEPWIERSNTQQVIYNKKINKLASDFLKNSLVPKLNEELVEKLGNGKWIEVDKNDEMVINFWYPQLFKTTYIISCVRLEIGPLAEWVPSHTTRITSFVGLEYGRLFEQVWTDVLTVDAERTFWEKITILHKIANYPKGKILPHRYARHFYDVYCMGNSMIKKSAFDRRELLENVVKFKQKFYYSKSAHYETATLENIKLIPSSEIIDTLKQDYSAMFNMFYGVAPSFEEILKYLKSLECEIHSLQEI